MVLGCVSGAVVGPVHRFGVANVALGISRVVVDDENLIDQTRAEFWIGNKQRESELGSSDLATAVGAEDMRVILGTLMQNGSITYEETSLRLNEPSGGAAT